MPATQRLLADLAQRYTRLFRSAQDGILIMDYPDGRIKDANPYICELIGYRREELLGKQLWEIGLIKDKSKAKAAHQTILTTGFVRYEDLDLVTKSGTRQPVEFICNSYPIDGLKMIQCNIRNISARRLMEKGLAEEQATALANEQAKLIKQMHDTIDSLTNIIEMRDPYTAGHQVRVTNLSVAIGQEMSLPKPTIDCLRFCGQIHDIGKVGIPAEILTKPTTLTPLEIAILRGHVQAGYDIIKPLTFPWPVGTIILQHHERLDGSGYPYGLKGDQICLEARILGVADTVEAITSDRPYRPAKGIETALKEIEAASGKLYDEKVVASCLKLFREKGYRFPDRPGSELHRL